MCLFSLSLSLLSHFNGLTYIYVLDVSNLLPLWQLIAMGFKWAA